MVVNTKNGLPGPLSSIHWRQGNDNIKLEVHNEDDLSRLSVLVPWIEKVPFDPAPWLIQGWRNVWSAKDISMSGFVPTVNLAMGYIPSQWTLIWNSDAWPQFTQQEMEATLDLLPSSVAVAAPISEPSDKAVQVTGERIPGRRFMYWNITDMGPLAVSMAPGSEEHLYALVHGTAYAPLYAVKTAYFRHVGGLSTLYGPGYFDDAHFWRLTRRLGYDTAILPRMEYKHEGRKSFKEVWSEEDLRLLHEENLRRYLLSWGAIESQPPVVLDSEGEMIGSASKDPGQVGLIHTPEQLGSGVSAFRGGLASTTLAHSPAARTSEPEDIA